MASNNAWIQAAPLDNLVPYNNEYAAWCGEHSIVCLSWPHDDQPGLQTLQTLVGWGGEIIIDRLLQWHLESQGRTIAPVLSTRTFRPDRIREQDQAGPIQIDCDAAYPTRNAIACVFTLRNTAATAQDFTLHFDYLGQPPDWKGQRPARQVMSFEGEPPGSWSTLVALHEHGRNVEWVHQEVAGITEGTTLELVCLSDCSPRTFSLQPGESTSFTLFLCFGLTLGRAKSVRERCVQLVQTGWSPQQCTQSLHALMQQAAELPNPDSQRQRMYTHAVASLRGLFIGGDGGYTGTKRLCWTSTRGIASAFYWDTAFSAMGALEFSPALSRESILCFAENASVRGGMPGTLCDTHRAGEGQAEVMAWSTWKVYQAQPEQAWLSQVYPALCNYNRFWRKYHSSPRGFFLYYNAGQIGDNDVRFDAVYGRAVSNEPIAGFEPPDLNALFVIQMRALAKMAQALGKPEEAADWTRRADELTRAIVDTFYFPEHAMFLDVKEGTREIFSGTKNPNMFFPLLLPDLPLPRSEIARIIETHMLNPQEFWRPLPFPSVSYDNPAYDHNGYWRGCIWPHIGFIMLQILWQHGYHEQADIGAQWYLKLFSQTPWFHENYNSADGEGRGLTDKRYVLGIPDYNWSLATVIRLLLRRYREPIL